MLSKTAIDRFRTFVFPLRTKADPQPNIGQLHYDLVNYNLHHNEQGNLCSKSRTLIQRHHCDEFSPEYINGPYIQKAKAYLEETKRELGIWKRMLNSPCINLDGSGEKSIVNLLAENLQAFLDGENPFYGSLACPNDARGKSKEAIKKFFNPEASITEAGKFFIRALDGLFRTLDALIGIKVELDKNPSLRKFKRSIFRTLGREINNYQEFIKSLVSPLTEASKKSIETEINFWTRKKEYLDVDLVQFTEIAREAVISLLGGDRLILMHPDFVRFFEQASYENLSEEGIALKEKIENALEKDTSIKTAILKFLQRNFPEIRNVDLELEDMMKSDTIARKAVEQNLGQESLQEYSLLGSSKSILRANLARIIQILVRNILDSEAGKKYLRSSRNSIDLSNEAVNRVIDELLESGETSTLYRTGQKSGHPIICFRGNPKRTYAAPFITLKNLLNSSEADSFKTAIGLKA